MAQIEQPIQAGGKANAGATAGSAPAQAVAGTTPADAKANAPAAPPLPVGTPPKEQSSVIPFGGNRGGKPRKDGLVPGSPEAREADLKKDRERKARAYGEKKRTRELVREMGAPLPAKLEGGPAPAPGAVQPLVEGSPGLPVPQGDSWTPLEARPLITNALPVAEHLLHGRKLRRLRKAGAPANLLQQIRADMAWPEVIKATLAESAPGTAAKVLTYFEVPKMFKDELSSLPALVALIQHENGVNEKIDIIIAELEAARKDREAKP